MNSFLVNETLDTAPLAGVPLIFFLAAITCTLIIIPAFYVYFSFAFKSIGEKTRYKHPNVSWIPIVGPGLIVSKAAKMHWWPLLLLIGILIPIINDILFFMITIFFMIWLWKTYESLKIPREWAIFFPAIPLIFYILLSKAIENFLIIMILGFLLFGITILNMIFIGIAAWKKREL